jgi:hypothetical protein
VLQLEQSRSRLQSRTPGFSPRAVRLGLVIGKVAVGEVFLQLIIIRVSPVSLHSTAAVWATLSHRP